MTKDGLPRTSAARPRTALPLALIGALAGLLLLVSSIRASGAGSYTAADAGAGAGSLVPTAAVEHAAVVRGGAVTISSRGWRARQEVQFRLGQGFTSAKASASGWATAALRVPVGGALGWQPVQVSGRGASGHVLLEQVAVDVLAAARR